MNESMEQMEKATQNLMQACMESGSALTKGCDEMSRNIGTIMQESMARALTTGKTMMGARNIQEIADLQAEFMKGCFEQWMSGAGQLSKISMRMTQETLEPMTKQAHETFNRTSQERAA